MLSTYRRLFDLLDADERRRFWLLLALILAMGVLDMAGVAAIFPFLAVLASPEVVDTNPWLRTAYDLLGFASTDGFLLFLGFFTFALVVIGQAVKALTIFALTRFSKMREYAISSRLLEAYLRQPYVWFLSRHSSDLGTAILSEVGKVIDGVLVPALRVLAQAVLAVFLVGLLFVVHPGAAVGTAVSVGISYGIVFALVRRYLTRIGRDRVHANTERYRAVQEAMGGIKEVKLLGIEDAYLRRFQGPAARFAQHQAASMVITELPRYLLEAVVFGGLILLLLILMAGAEGRLSAVLPVVGVFAFAGARLFPAMQQLFSGIAMIRFHRPALDVLHADMAAAGAVSAGGGAHAPAAMPLRDRLELRDVRYVYPEAERPALHGLDLTIGANTTVGIVGATGAGKTTAVDIILGLLEPQSGQILVDGTPLGPESRRAWQLSLGYVPQHIFLTDDTVAANIALGTPPDAIDMAAVERAARMAELHGFVTEELPQGYRTSVGERGVRLSGGQRQRIGIARALYRDPEVLVLDEATSALDNVTERALMDAVHNLAHRKTIIMIAHRLSTVRNCDTIFVLEQGRCRVAGGYDQLLDNDRVFQRLALVAQ